MTFRRLIVGYKGQIAPGNVVGGLQYTVNGGLVFLSMLGERLFQGLAVELKLLRNCLAETVIPLLTEGEARAVDDPFFRKISPASGTVTFIILVLCRIPGLLAADLGGIEAKLFSGGRCFAGFRILVGLQPVKNVGEAFCFKLFGQHPDKLCLSSFNVKYLLYQRLLNGDMTVEISFATHNGPLLGVVYGSRQYDVGKHGHLGYHGNNMGKERHLSQGLVPACPFGAGEVEVVVIADGHLDVVGVFGQDAIGYVVGNHPTAGLAAGQSRKLECTALVDLFVFGTCLGNVVLEGIELGVTAGRSAHAYV